MSKDDIFYFVILLISILFANLVRTLPSPRQKRWVVFVVGMILVLVTCGYSTFHSLITVTVNLLIIKFVTPKFCHVVSFIWCFGYLSFFRLGNLLFGLPPAVSYLNAVQLLLTLKMTGLSFEIHDNYEKHKKFKKDLTDAQVMNEFNSAVKKLDANDVELVEPSLVDMFVYSYSFIGVVTGPYYTYKTFNDMIENNVSNIHLKNQVTNRIKYLPLIISTFLLLSYFYKLEDVKDPSFYTSTSLKLRILYMVIMFTIFRMRLYIAWLLSETVCMCAHLGMYPVECSPKCGRGPMEEQVYSDWKKKSMDEKMKSEFNFEVITNLDIRGCELVPTVRRGMKCWNMSVQYWLANNIYKRLNPIKSNSVRAGVTMLVSAYWHGVHPGYYMSFLLIPFHLLAEDLMIHAFKLTSLSKNELSNNIFNALLWFFKMRSFDYLCMGFLLLSFEDTVKYWGSIYYCGHVLIAVVLVFGLLLKKILRKDLKKET